jgi:plastocyanin
MRRPAQILMFVMLIALAAACAESNEVGSQELLEFDPEASGAPRLGERVDEPTPSPTPEAVVATPAPPPQETQPPPPPPQETQAPPSPQDTGPQVALEISITGDQSGTSQFDPSAARIFAGTCARWINRDSVARSVEADEADEADKGAFASGAIEPGGEWVWCPEATGRFNYHDGTRPYAVAFIEVVPR